MCRRNVAAAFHFPVHGGIGQGVAASWQRPSILRLLGRCSWREIFFSRTRGLSAELLRRAVGCTV
jgi:hypothetical protein